MTVTHRLLLRQLRRLGLAPDAPPADRAQWQALLERVDRAYVEADQDRYLLERSQATSSREMQELYERLEAAQRAARLGNWSFDRDERLRVWSEECYRIFGVEPGTPVPRYAEFMLRVDARDRHALNDAIRTAWDGGRPFEIEFRLQRADGAQRWVHASAQPLRSSIGKVAQLHGTVIDITERKLVELQLRESEAHFRALVEQASDSFFVHDIEGRILDVNERGCRALGYSREQLLGMKLWDICEGLTADDLRELQQQLGERAPIALEGGYRRRDGTGFPVEISLGPIQIDGQQHLLSLVRDISERRQMEAHIRHLAFHDPLTDLPNRAMFARSIGHAVVQAERYGRSLALLFIDLDRFKNINDTLGHEAGDRLLGELGRRLRACLREGDLVARLGGDEFVVLVEEVADPSYVGHIARKILAALVREHLLDGQLVHMTASIGIALYPQDGRDEKSLMRFADIAMYRAKEKGKNGYEFFSAQMNERGADLLALESQLRGALQREELALHYQPKVAVASGRIVGAEALVRWQHPQLGLLPPARFIALAEESGLIVPMGRWVLREAARQACIWSREGLPLRIAVNLSARQFADDDLLADVAAALAETGLPAHGLELEVTESMVMVNPERTAQVLVGLKAMGVSIAIDDFGIGYSSLAHLKRFPFDVLKIDQSFVKDVVDDPACAAITQAIIAMSKSLGHVLVAEGVETQAQLQFLQRNQCDQIQGSFISRPLPAPAFAALLRREAARWAAAPADHMPT